jgi:ATP-dependent helicase/nuclease subunit B
MIFPGPAPRVFALPPGADFPAQLAGGLRARMAGQVPEAMAAVTIFLNTQRMRRRLLECLTAGGATILPRLRLVTDLGADPLLGGGTAVSPLARRLELAVLVDRLLQAEPGLAPRSALFDLADSLAGLMDEMRAEAVAPDRVIGLDVAAHAGHWARTQRFVGLVAGFFGPSAVPDHEARLRLATERLIARWQQSPPPGPVIVAGSTGSRGTTALLMRAVVGLPQGALLLPGFDLDQPEAVWAGMEDPLGHEDHPQFRYRRLMDALGISRADVRLWDAAPAADPARNRLVSLALRPAPVTDQWIADGPGLGDLAKATRGLTLIEAPGPRQEALAIALRLRRALEEGQSAALLTPDRELTRRVTAALDRWGIAPDDSAGVPLLHTPPGRLLRMIARAMGRRLAMDEVLALLKHPLAFAGGDRGEHLRLSRDLELHLRRYGPAFPEGRFLAGWAQKRQAEAWAGALAQVLDGLAATGPAPLADLALRHRALAEALAGGNRGGPGPLWEKKAGAEALAAMAELAQEAPEGFHLPPQDYAALAEAVIARRQVREAVGQDPRLQILGPQEARIQGADLVILAGLNEGIWPARPAPDPWLNRQMRAEAGLLLPERRIGLSAHDFQIATAAPQVVLSRALRDAEAETVASRWLNRLTNLLAGLPGTDGPAALAAMKARGAEVLAQAETLDAPLPAPQARRPAPRPPPDLRPNRLSLTEVEKLIRDPYAIYARHVLRLQPLSPLRALADARLRGEVLHRVPEAFLKAGVPQDPGQATDLLMQITDRVLAEDVPWPGMRAVWRARMAEIARPFVERLLAEGATPVVLERKYQIEIPGLGFTLVGKPDRIDRAQDGRVTIVDYKTGTPPSLPQQDKFAKQLDLAAVMAALGAFPELGPVSQVRTTYLGLKPGLKEVTRTRGEEDIARILAEFTALVLAYRDPDQGYTARRAVFDLRSAGDYDDLARYGEWDMTADPVPEGLQ